MGHAKEVVVKPASHRLHIHEDNEAVSLFQEDGHPYSPRYVQRVITPEELAVSGDSPVEIIPAPGRGQVIVPVSLWCSYTYRPVGGWECNDPELQVGNIDARSFSLSGLDGLNDANNTTSHWKITQDLGDVGDFDQLGYNQPLVFQCDANPDAYGPVKTFEITDGGTGYAVDDTVKIDSNSGDCVLRVTSVSGGVITGLEFDSETENSQGTIYHTGTGRSLDAVDSSGDGAEVSITEIELSPSILLITVLYIVVSGITIPS